VKRLLLASFVMLAACGGRPPIWDATPGGSTSKTQVLGLEGSVAIIDDDGQRAMMLVPKADQELDRIALPIGKHVIRADAAPDRSRLFVLASGDQPRRTERDQRPSLTVIENLESKRYELATPLSGLSIDPQGKWAAVYAGGKGGTAFVENPNELVLIDLEAPPGPSNPVTTTLRSFGGRPQRVTFAPKLSLPEGPRRLLVVETEQDVSILDLDHVRDPLPRPEVTVRLTSGGDAHVVTPAGVVFHDGKPDRSDDARIGIRLANDTSVVTLELAAAAKTEGVNDFAPKINLTDVSGIASDISFVQTDGGLRLAALVPSKGAAVLVETETSVTTDVKLPAAYSQMSLITDIVGSGGTPTDVALLWNAPSLGGGVAFWSLGKTSGQPYRSVEVLNVNGTVTKVQDVPKPHTQLKILETGAAGFFVLDLASRTAAPLTTLAQATIALAPDGERMWAYERAAMKLAEVDLVKLHPIPLVVDRPIDSVFDVSRADGGRSLIAIHARGAYGATVFDARDPDTATARLHGGLLLEGL
jgi:hypothetical protein